MKKKLLLLTLFLNSFLIFSQAPPNFTMEDCDGNEYTFSELFSEGKAIVLDLGSQWCGPCQSATQGIQDLYEYFGQNQFDVLFFGLMFEDNSYNLASCETVHEWDEQFNLTYPTLPAGIGNNANIMMEIADIYEVYGIPYFIAFMPDPNDPTKGIVIYDDNTSSMGYYNGIKTALLNNGYEKEEGNLNTESFSLEDEFLIFPNPANEKIFIESGASVEIESISIFSVRGEVLKSIKNEVKSINIGELSSGVYFIEIKHKNGLAKFRFLKD
ncbi:T9SS type A sorting domain-containing protein [Aureivirga sp. CE67]|uniref:T9SS type A sorting domain-containing protein n=1 Tax=Aureivirga sp. CE67 TaxID=1788983 RepID=UPI0018C9EACB|nr:T9SS type A sorting domain-containing protein [Aureivirga sp. CE67]